MRVFKYFIPVISVLVFFSAIQSNAEIKISEGELVKVCWRYVPSSANQFEFTGKFDNCATVKTIKSPFGDGGITGSSIVLVVNAKKGKNKIKEIRALDMQQGGDPATSRIKGALVVRDDDSLYDNYALRNNNMLEMYLNVIIQ